MIRGVVNCACAQIFGFETMQEKICCPDCKEEFYAKEYALPEVTEDGADI